MPTRRDTLRLLGAASAAALTGSRSAAQPAPFTGEAAGERREIEGVRFCWCPPGRFTMGSPPGETGRRADEAQVEVRLSRGFWLAACETTQGEWQRIHGAPTERPLAETFGLGDDMPVYWVSYLAAEAYCRALADRARRSGALPAGWTCRLPTEAQWEYACRAGTTTATAFGDSLDRADANFNGAPLNGGVDGPAAGRATPVRTFRANPWGLHDMHGNIFEWCRDWYHARLPGGVDPDVQVKGEPNRDGSYSRVRRGGAWNDAGVFCRSALRLRYEPERSSDHIGFRVALVQGR
jgi:formylglycine-generating enzyme required for sulfatase activity